MCWCFGGHLHVFLLMFYLPMGFPDGSDGKESTWMQETQVWSLGWEGPQEKGMATPSSILAQRTPRTEEPDGLQSLRSQRVGHDWVTNILIHFALPSNSNFCILQWDKFLSWHNSIVRKLEFSISMFLLLFVENVCIFVSVWERSNDSSVFTAYILKKKYFLRRYFLVRLNIYKLNYRIKGFLKCTFLYNHKLLFILMKDGKISYFLFSI